MAINTKSSVLGRSLLRGCTLLAASNAVLSIGGCQNKWAPFASSQPTPSRQEPLKTDHVVAVHVTPVQRPAASQTEAPDEAAAQLSQEIQQYVNNLAMDDLQAKVARQGGQPVGQAAGNMGGAAESAIRPQVQSSAADGTVAGQAAPIRHMPLEPEFIIPGQEKASTPRKPTWSPAASRDVPQMSAVQKPAMPAVNVTDKAAAPDALHPGSPPAPTARVAAPAPMVSAAMPVVSPLPVTAGNDGVQVVEIEISPAVLSSLPGAAQSTRAAAPQTNQPAAVKPPVADDLKQLIDRLRQEAAARPGSVGAALRLRLAEWSLTGHAQSPEEWSLQDADQRRLAQSVWKVLQVVSKMEASPQGAEQGEFQTAIESLTETLRQVQPLQIPTALLCRSVSSFGCPEALPEPWQFQGGRTSMVVLYCELAGFASEQAEDKNNWYRTLLSERLAILTSSGKELWNYEDQQVEDFCRRPRRDFFITKLLKIPPELPAGDYVLKVTIRDRIANRVTETNLPFAVAIQTASNRYLHETRTNQEVANNSTTHHRERKELLE